MTMIYPGTEWAHDIDDADGWWGRGRSAADTLSTAVYAVSIVCAVKIDIAGSYPDAAWTAVDRRSAVYAHPIIDMVLVLLVHLLLLAGHATDWDCMDVAYPASAYDADGPFGEAGVLVGDWYELFDGLMIW